jgi:hypothetical protein
VSRTARLHPSPGLHFAPFEIFPERRPKPLAARSIALALAGSAGLLTLLHRPSIRCASDTGKPPEWLDIGRLIRYSLACFRLIAPDGRPPAFGAGPCGSSVLP